MADSKEFQIGNKAKDLLIYTFTVTKPVSDKSMESKDVLGMMLKLKELPPDEAQAFYQEAEERLKKVNSKQGYPKSTVHSYIKLIRECVVGIVVNIQMANDCRFETEYDDRLRLIDEVLKGCNLMLQLINISLELNYITMNRCKHWTKMVTDVKYMTLSWKKKDQARSESIRKREKASEVAQLQYTITQAVTEALKAVKG